jgi:hypothetical protein
VGEIETLMDASQRSAPRQRAPESARPSENRMGPRPARDRAHVRGEPADAAALARAAEAYRLAERSFVWCSDCVSEPDLRLSVDLYERARRLALAADVADASATPPCASAAELRSHALQLRLEVAALLRTRRGRHTARALQLGLALTLLLAVALHARIADALGVGEVSRGAMWWASSSDANSLDGGTLAPASAPFFFHTRHEDRPWLEIDLGRDTHVRRAIVENRSDCCQSRAAPLVLEASLDHKHWQPLAEQSASFDTWRVSFPRQAAHYVRLRALRRTSLHLKSVTLRD